MYDLLVGITVKHFHRTLYYVFGANMLNIRFEYGIITMTHQLFIKIRLKDGDKNDH